MTFPDPHRLLLAIYATAGVLAVLWAWDIELARLALEARV